MKHLNADLDNITNVETDKTPVGAIRAIGVDSENDIVLTGVISTDSDGGDLDVGTECTIRTVSTDFRFQTSLDVEYPSGSTPVGELPFTADNFRKSRYNQVQIDDLTNLPTLAALTKADGTALDGTFAEVLPGNLTIEGLDDSLGTVVIRYSSARLVGGVLTLGGPITRTFTGTARTLTLTARTNSSGTGGVASTIATYNDTQFSDHQFNSGSFNLTASNFRRGRIAGIWIQPANNTEQAALASELGVAINNLPQNVTGRPINFTFTSGANTFTLAVHRVTFTTGGGAMYIVGRLPFQDIQTDQFVSGSGTFSPNGATWTMSYSIGGTETVVHDPLGFVAGTGGWGTDTSTTSQICIGGNTMTISDDADGRPGGITSDGDINIGGQITQGALNGPVFADETGTLDVGNIYADNVPAWDGTTIVNSPISQTAVASITTGSTSNHQLNGIPIVPTADGGGRMAGVGYLHLVTASPFNDFNPTTDGYTTITWPDNIGDIVATLAPFNGFVSTITGFNAATGETIITFPEGYANTAAGTSATANPIVVTLTAPANGIQVDGNLTVTGNFSQTENLSSNAIPVWDGDSLENSGITSGPVAPSNSVTFGLEEASGSATTGNVQISSGISGSGTDYEGAEFPDGRLYINFNQASERNMIKDDFNFGDSILIFVDANNYFIGVTESFAGMASVHNLCIDSTTGSFGASVGSLPAEGADIQIANLGTLTAAYTFPTAVSAPGDLDVAGNVSGTFTGLIDNQNDAAGTSAANFRIWAGTQAEFNALTEVTDGSVLYIIRS